ncbi:hypothetical protein O9992_08470 [Vibrio lentus]|nr:hypothetical protein [Vibrio lentus]
MVFTAGRTKLQKLECSERGENVEEATEVESQVEAEAEKLSQLKLFQLNLSCWNQIKHLQETQEEQQPARYRSRQKQKRTG